MSIGPKVGHLTVFVQGSEREKRVITAGQTIRVGREDINDLVIDEPGISRLHAAFCASGSGLAVTDLSSTNGTFVNGQRIDSLRLLSNGDVVDLGTSKLVVELVERLVDQAPLKPLKRALTTEMKPVGVAVLVAAICNFSELCEAWPIQKLAELQFRWADHVTRMIQSCGGDVQKMVGPAVVCMWSGEDQQGVATAAVEAAISLLAEVAAHFSGTEFSELDTGALIATSTGLSANKEQDSSAKCRSTGLISVLGDPTGEALLLQPLCLSATSRVVVSAEASRLLAGRYTLKHFDIKLVSADPRLKGACGVVV